jgi:hypothetical protein
MTIRGASAGIVLSAISIPLLLGGIWTLSFMSYAWSLIRDMGFSWEWLFIFGLVFSTGLFLVAFGSICAWAAVGAFRGKL